MLLMDSSMLLTTLMAWDWHFLSPSPVTCGDFTSHSTTGTRTRERGTEVTRLVRCSESNSIFAGR